MSLVVPGDVQDPGKEPCPVLHFIKKNSISVSHREKYKSGFMYLLIEKPGTRHTPSPYTVALRSVYMHSLLTSHLWSGSLDQYCLPYLQCNMVAFRYIGMTISFWSFTLDLFPIPVWTLMISSELLCNIFMYFAS